jgi:hypothetical protein
MINLLKRINIIQISKNIGGWGMGAFGFMKISKSSFKRLVTKATTKKS